MEDTMCLGNRVQSSIAVGVIVGFLVSSTACYKRITIKKSETSKVNRFQSSSNVSAAQFAAEDTQVAKGTVRFETPDGTIYSLAKYSDPPLIIIDGNGNKREYNHPIQVTSNEETLKIQTLKSSKTYEKTNIDAVKLKIPDPVATHGLILGTGAVIIIPIAIAASSH